MTKADVLNYYSQSDEQQRLLHGQGALEFTRIQELVRRFLPKPPAQVYDVGGTSTAHAMWLAEDGYTVEILDSIAWKPELLEEISQDQKITATIGDARRLPWRNGSADVTLVLGPLYHLTDRFHRIAALSEAKRVTVAGGLVVVAAISRFASLFDGLTKNFLADPVFEKLVDQVLADGCHYGSQGERTYFTTAYFHRPEELLEEMQDAGFVEAEIFGVEGPAGFLADIDKRWVDENWRKIMLELARKVESDPLMVAISSHMLAVARV